MNKLSSKTSLFLIELVLSIFFFIVATAICMQLFVNTYFFSLQTKEINQALLWSQNLAEPFLGNNGDYCIIKTLFGDIDCIKDFTIETSNGEFKLTLTQEDHKRIQDLIWKKFNFTPSSELCEEAYS